ncbi:MAG: TRAP transporter small permease [Sulfitobacter sp.]
MKAPLWLAAAALFVMMVLTFADVTLRSVASAPIPGAAELTEILLAVVVFVSLPLVVMTDRQISVDLLDHLMSARTRRWRDAAGNLIVGVLLFWPVWRCWVSTMRTFGYEEVTLYLRIPVGWIFMLVTIGLAVAAVCMLLRGVILLWRPALLDADNATSIAT